MPNRMIVQVAAFIIIIAMAQGSLAQVSIPKVYVGLGVGTLSYTEDDEELGIDTDLSIYALNLRLGIDFNEYLSAELRGSLGLSEDSDILRVGSYHIDLTSKVETIFGLHARLRLPTNSPVTPYVMLGYARTEASGSAEILLNNFSIAELSGEDSMSEVSYGVGVDVGLGIIRLNAEYAKYDEVDALSIGIVRGF